MSCPHGKLQYATAAAAQRVLSHVAGRKKNTETGNGAGWHRGKTIAYRCPVCSAWHIGHATSAIKNRRQSA